MEITSQELISLDSVSHSYSTEAGRLEVLHDVSFSLAPGNSLAIVGPSALRRKKHGKNTFKKPFCAVLATVVSRRLPRKPAHGVPANVRRKSCWNDA